MTDKINPEDKSMMDGIAHRLSSFTRERSSLIPILQMIQEEYKYLPPEAITMVAGYLDMTSCEVYGVATFYNQFRFTPPGRHHVKVCLGTACHVRGGDIILERFERKLEIKAGQTTPDREFSIERAACVGCCALAPVAVLDGDTIGHIAPSKVEGIFLGFELQKKP